MYVCSEGMPGISNKGGNGQPKYTPTKILMQRKGTPTSQGTKELDMQAARSLCLGSTKYSNPTCTDKVG